MKNEIEITDELIAKYFAGGATPEEAMVLDDWLQDPTNRSHFTAMQKVWQESFPSKSPRPVDLQKAWQAVNRRKGEIPQHVVTPFYQKTIFKIAASVALVLAIGAIFYLTNRDTVSPYLTVATKDSLKTVSFADQSTATLNRNTALEYPKAFADNQREVRLSKGEAFFNIQADPSRSFIIHTHVATIKVLGTAFNVILGDKTLDVSVDHGKVLVYTASDSIHLTTGQAVAYATIDTKYFKRHESNSNVWAYATHKLVFNNTPLRDVFLAIEKTQNCVIIDHMAIENCKLTATFEQVSTDYMLNLIAEALNLSVTKHDDRTFTVEGEGCH